MPESNPMAAKALAEGEATTPEDVATLYSWANLHGAKYRDFSASRAQAREEARLRVEEAQAEERRRQKAEAERKAQEEAQLAARLAAEAAEAARQAEAERLAEIARQAEAERQAVLAAQEAQRQAALQRSWQPPVPEPFTPASQPASNPSPSIEYAGQAYDSERIAQPAAPVSQRPARNPAPYAPPAQSQPQPASSASNSYPRPAYPPAANDFPDYPAAQYALPQYSAEPYLPQQVDPYAASPWHAAEMRESREMREPFSQPAWLAPEPPAAPALPRNQIPAQDQNPIRRSQPSQPQFSQPAQTYIPMYAQTPGNPPGSGSGSGPGYGPEPGQGQNAGPVDDTLAGSRDRIANRWYALKNVFDPQAAPVEQQPAQPPARVPVLAVFSLAGGVGKTSLVASLGRALSSRGERVLLIDTAAYGLLPFFFGARDQRPGMLRTFNPPGVSADAPIQLVTIDPESQPPEHRVDPNQPSNLINQDPNQHPYQAQSLTPNQDWLASEVARYTRSANRVLIDLPTASGSTTRRVLRLAPVVLVPVLPDMNSVVSVGAIEAFFRNNGSGINTGGKQILPYYVLNQFDYSLPLHLDVREILREQIGDRLLPFALRRSPAVSEALAEGMTVMDYAPNAVVAEDYANLAGWVRGLSAPATQSYRGVRWSER
jgi:cellulose synthase operon protein YhjQ